MNNNIFFIYPPHSQIINLPVSGELCSVGITQSQNNFSNVDELDVAIDNVYEFLVDYRKDLKNTLELLQSRNK